MTKCNYADQSSVTGEITMSNIAGPKSPGLENWQKWWHVCKGYDNLEENSSYLLWVWKKEIVSTDLYSNGYYARIQCTN